ncbi:MAG: hypothetical protein ABF260_00725 [Flavobacteriaceae bacterium]|jgi:hypothetical protein
MIPNPEKKFETVFNSLTEKTSEQLMFNTFLKMYPEEWKQLKITFSKFKRSKQFGKTIPLSRPEESLRKSIRVWLRKKVL